MDKLSIFSLRSDAYAQAVRSRLGKGAMHARIIYREWFHTGKVTGQDPHFSNAQTLFQQILDITDFSYLPLLKRGDKGDTEKYLLETHDGLEIEMVSINSPNDAMRNRLMPVNRRFDMNALKVAMEAYTAHPRRRILIEYVLIKGKTDALSDADALADYLKGLKVTVNLIPYNPQSRASFEPPEPEVVDLFLKRMKEHGYLTFVRSTKGQKIMAACGQLGNRELRKRKKTLVFSRE